MQYNLNTKTKTAYQARSVANLLRMGHCAPAVMQTVLELTHAEQEWLVKLMAGMPGGIGNTGFECGALTSPLVILGLRHGLTEMRDGLPLIFDLGHAYHRRFTDQNAASFCKDILGHRRLPIPCIHCVRRSPGLLAETQADGRQPALPQEQRQAAARLYAHLAQNDFHCAQAVFRQLNAPQAPGQELLDAASAFMGGALFMGTTCSAFTAGVMAIGLKTGEIENSFPRVVRMLGLMAVRGNPFAEHLNKFNRAMNTGYRLSKWFRAEFGSTQCQAITQCDFSSAAGVEKYIACDGITRCRRIAGMVAEQVRNIH